MPKVSVLDVTGKTVSEIELSDALFGIKPNKAVLHLAIVNYLANQRQGTQSTKTRAEVSGGGKKPWRQKGTGHARQGSTRSPQWTHGGVALGPKPRDYRISLNKKVRKLAIRSAFSSKALAENVIVVNDIQLNEIKTKQIFEILGKVGVGGKKALVILPENNQTLVKSARNIRGIKTAQVNTVNVYDILKADKLVILQNALPKLEEVYAS